VDDAYTDVKNDKPKIGDIRIRFTCVDLDTMDDVTVLAIQTGNTFSRYHLEGYGYMDKFWLKPLTKKEALAALEGDAESAKFGAWMVSGIFLLIGVYRFWAKKNKAA
jgi:hypothetical protein